MNTALPLFASLFFVALALWHFHMAASPASDHGATVPSMNGRPVFRPSPGATVAVGVVLLLFAGLVAGTAGLLPTSLPRSVLRWLSAALSLGLLARALGEFKYVGFFKRVRDTKFATLDTWLYSPLCVLLAFAVAFIANPNCLLDDHWRASLLPACVNR